MAISDRIGILENGTIVEEGTPEELYWNPRRSGTASFMGFFNLFKVRGRNDKGLITDIGVIPVEVGKTPDRIGFRSESTVREGDGYQITGTVLSREYRGREHLIDIRVGNSIVRTIDRSAEGISPGNRITVRVPMDMFVPLTDDEVAKDKHRRPIS
jgi:multiple sugar transport system ATP-binding protein